MEIFEVDILKIYSEKHHKRTVEIDADIQHPHWTPERRVIAFHNHEWADIKRKMKYLETKELSHPDYFESMTDEEYRKWQDKCDSSYDADNTVHSEQTSIDNLRDDILYIMQDYLPRTWLAALEAVTDTVKQSQRDAAEIAEEEKAKRALL